MNLVNIKNALWVLRRYLINQMGHSHFRVKQLYSHTQDKTLDTNKRHEVLQPVVAAIRWCSRMREREYKAALLA